MTDTEQKLAELEIEMGALTGLRAQRIAVAQQRIAVAQAMIDSANRDFDEAAIPLGRRINRLRAKLESENQTVTVTHSQVVRESHDPDPEWSQDDIDHFKELRRRESHNSRSARQSAA